MPGYRNKFVFCVFRYKDEQYRAKFFQGVLICIAHREGPYYGWVKLSREKVSRIEVPKFQMIGVSLG